MLDILKEIFTSPAGSFGSMFAILTLLFFLAYKSGQIVNSFKVVDVIQNSIAKIKDDIAEIKAFIQVFKQGNNPFAKSNSPISLTPLGSEVKTDLHLERIVNDNWDKLNKQIKSELENEDNPYNIQEVCFAIGQKYSMITPKNDFDLIKKYAFKKGYNLSDFDLIFGIIIRDKFLSEKGIPVSDIDIHDPNKKEKV